MRVLNLGAGVQSTAVYLMMRAGIIPPADYAIFADTQDEPEGVYSHLRWLESLNSIPILIRTRGRLSEHLKVGQNPHGGRFASIPAYTTDGHSPVGRVRRQCSSEYKIDVIDRTIRREVLGLKPRQRVPKGTHVTQIFGISLDEAGRATRLYERIVLGGMKWISLQFPLIDRFLTRTLCKEWLAKQGIPHEVPRSACVYCPFHSDAEWLRIKANPSDWKLAVEVDEALRVPGNVVNRQLDQKLLYVHRSCQPLTQITFAPIPESTQTELNFANECLGVCGV